VGVNPTAGRASFKAFITAFNETWNTNWNSEVVYGRIDPIVMFKNTERSVSLGFKVVAADIFEAKQNMAELQTLISSLYPSYTKFNTNGANGAIYDGTITQSPLIRIQIADLLANSMINYARKTAPQPGAGDVNEQADRLMGSSEFGAERGAESTLSDDLGVLAYVRNFTVNYNLEGEAGIFEGNFGQTGHLLLPKLIEVNLDFGVLHEKRMGWWLNTHTGDDANGTFTWRGESITTQGSRPYPYSIDPAFKKGMPGRLNYHRENVIQTSAPSTNPEQLPEGSGVAQNADEVTDEESP